MLRKNSDVLGNDLTHGGHIDVPQIRMIMTHGCHVTPRHEPLFHNRVLPKLIPLLLSNLD